MPGQPRPLERVLAIVEQLQELRGCLAFFRPSQTIAGQGRAQTGGIASE